MRSCLVRTSRRSSLTTHIGHDFLNKRMIMRGLGHSHKCVTLDMEVGGMRALGQSYQCPTVQVHRLLLGRRGEQGAHHRLLHRQAPGSSSQWQTAWGVCGHSGTPGDIRTEVKNSTGRGESRRLRRLFPSGGVSFHAHLSFHVLRLE